MKSLVCYDEDTLDISICGFKIHVIVQKFVAFDNYRLDQKYQTDGEEIGKKICPKIYLLSFKNSNILQWPPESILQPGSIQCTYV